MRFVGIICSLTFMLTHPPLAAAHRQVDSRPALTRREAQQVWELGVAAKGGRERLRSVRSMLVSVKTRHYLNVELHAFPDKFWRLSSLPEPLGRSALMYNLELGFGYTADGERPGGGAVKLHESSLGGGRVVLEDAQLFYLMETRWAKPTPVSVSSGEVNGRRADVVRTILGDRTVDFYLDRKTRLPLKVALISKTDGKVYWYKTFSEYADVGGIQMPLVVRPDGGGKLPTSFQFNVEYDERIFERPPSALAAPDAWRTEPLPGPSRITYRYLSPSMPRLS
jgi:hypothetical protein